MTTAVRVRFTCPVEGPPDRFSATRHPDDRHELVASAVVLDGDELRFLLADEIVERWPVDLVDSIEWIDTAAPWRERGAQPSRLGERWSAEEDEELRQEHAAGRSLPAMAAAHQRNAGGIRSRLVKLGLLEA